MYNVVKVVDLVRHFSASCRRYGLCEEETFPQNFISIIKELEKYDFLLLSLSVFPLNHHASSLILFCFG